VCHHISTGLYSIHLHTNSTQNNTINSLNTELNPICHLLALLGAHHILHVSRIRVNPLNAELNPICHLMALLGAHHILHVSRISVNPLNAELNPICHLMALLGTNHLHHVSSIMVNLSEVNIIQIGTVLPGISQVNTGTNAVI
jgi:hypothetical protein